MLKTYFAGIVRHALTTAGGALAAAGYVSGDDVTAISGLAPVIVGAAWSIYQKWSNR